MTAPTSASAGRRPAPKPAPSLVHTRTGRLLVLTLATVTMVVEMTSLLVGVGVEVGSLTLSASAVPSLLLLGFLGVHSLGRVRDVERLGPFWVAMAAGIGLGVALFSRTGDTIDIAALLLAAANEELVYRFAVPVVITTALMVLRVPMNPARVIGYVAAGTWWVLLPGHQQQVASLANLLTYIAFAAVSALVVARSRAILPMAVAHCVLNIVTLSALRGDISEASRGALSACLLFLLVGTFAWPGDVRRRAADREDLVSDTTIDLRDGQGPSAPSLDGVPSLDGASTPDGEAGSGGGVGGLGGVGRPAEGEVVIDLTDGASVGDVSRR